MAPPQGLARFGRVTSDLRASMTLSHGITPSTCTLDILPHQLAAVTEHADLAFTFGRTAIRFPHCRLVRPHLQQSGGGAIITLQIVDRRWRWQFGDIHGRYNVRDSEGVIDPDTEQTPQQLARLLLDAMNESGYDVSQLPNEQRPAVDWTGANPAAELANLCDHLACRVVLGLDNRVRLMRVDLGRALPTADRMNAAYGLELPAKPDAILVVGGVVRYQAKFKLEAVGRTKDGEIRKLDDLPYKPADGWGREDPRSLDGVTDEKDRRRAKKYVWRMYRVVKLAGGKDDAGTLDVPGYTGNPLAEIDQVFPLASEQIKTFVDENGKKRPRPAVVEGVYWPGGFEFENTDPGTEYEHSFSVQGEQGIVTFSEPVYKLVPTKDEEGNETGGYDHEAADLYLTTSFGLTKEDTHQQERWAYEYITGQRQGTGQRILRYDEIVRTKIARYKEAKPTQVERVEDNLADAERESKHYIDADLLNYQTDTSDEAQYAGLVPIGPDGAIQQVTWEVGQGGATTRASRGIEHSRGVVPYAERRRQEKVAALAQQQQQFNILAGSLATFGIGRLLK